MRTIAHLRWWSAAAAVALAPGAFADSTYLHLPGVTGPSTTARYTGWFEVVQDSIVLVPGAYDGDRKTTSPNCTATLRTRLGRAGATVAQLVGGSIGTVKLERVTAAGVPYWQAVLRNGLFVQEVTSFDNGASYDTLVLRFEAAEITTYDVKPDGTRGSGTQGSFNCLVAW